MGELLAYGPDAPLPVMSFPRLSARKRGYTAQWEKARRVYLWAHPLCVMCEKAGVLTAAAVVDHITPHKGDQSLFWDEGNWQPLCKPCHDRHKQREEKGRATPIIGEDGWPIS